MHKYKEKKRKLSKCAQAGKYIEHIKWLLAAKLQLKLSLSIKKFLKCSVLQNGNTGSTVLSLSVAGLVLGRDWNKGWHSLA